MNVSIDNPAGPFPLLLVLLEGVGNQFVMLVSIKLDLSAEENL
jgi:hypothetical protein